MQLFTAVAVIVRMRTRRTDRINVMIDQPQQREADCEAGTRPRPTSYPAMILSDGEIKAALKLKQMIIDPLLAET